ncbi:MAG TPA: PQQ-binding-like beta-propeller repeat protein [Rhizomicrobium sp.]|nr:PQQ-binding-like beta-propeller repeat protein [Rhizomicrobium sp.]
MTLFQRKWQSAAVLAALCFFAGTASAQHETAPQAAAPAPETSQAAPVTADVTVSDAQMQRPDDGNWLLYGRTYDHQRFSPLTQIHRGNVKALRPVAIIQTGVLGPLEVSPVVVNGVMYIVTASDHVRAYDAASGHILWSYDPKLGFSDVCCGPEARGLAVAYGKVYVARLDGVVVALDARTGKQAWKSDRIATLPSDPDYYSFTAAPVAYDGMVVIGSAGGEWPIRGFVQAYDAQTGKLVWRFRATAAPDEPGGKTWAGDSWKYGGGSVWDTVAVDPTRDLILFATGNPNPDNWGENRKGDNAYTDSIVAIRAHDGKLAWWHQIVPHDLWDYDQASPVALFDADDGRGSRVPAAVEAGKSGDAVIVDRQTGKLLRKVAFVEHSANQYTTPSDKPVTLYPGANGGNVWSPGAFSPLTRFFYIQGNNAAWTYTGRKTEPYDPARPMIGANGGGGMKLEMDGPDRLIAPYGTLSAIDVDSGKIAWQYRSPLFMQGGVMTTASNLVFAGEETGDFDAFDARTGEKLWNFYLGVAVMAPPVSYRVGDVQYIAVAAGGAGGGGYTKIMNDLGRPAYGGVIAIFAVP